MTSAAMGFMGTVWSIIIICIVVTMRPLLGGGKK